ncbi:MAG TPA: hypothetical protein VLH19_05760 [Patescibacteria group bacterium]|nr:hypothetical protein [Patescibacteria group bacterium]
MSREPQSEWADIVPHVKELTDDEKTVLLLQNLWHKKGHNGCTFSQVVAQAPDVYHWQASLVSEIDCHTSEKIDQTVTSAANDPTIRLLSLVFPSVKSERDLKSLLRVLTLETNTVFLDHSEQVDDHVALSFRFLLENQSLAWIMGFGPYDFFAETRRSPYIELVIPVKPKPDDTYFRHNQDKSTAHVADQHLNLSEKVLDQLWHNTFRKTRKVLGHEPNVFSGARTTFTVTQEMMEKIRE